jgi:hypothetical protein
LNVGNNQIMLENKLTKDQANQVYDILVKKGGASETMRDSFLYHHCESKYGCCEYRFGGKLGFGGKYRIQYNKVDCYSEEETPSILNIINEINNELSKLNI